MLVMNKNYNYVSAARRSFVVGEKKKLINQELERGRGELRFCLSSGWKAGREPSRDASPSCGVVYRIRVLQSRGFETDQLASRWKQKCPDLIYTFNSIKFSFS